MRWVGQRTSTDCGIAVVAMVAEVSYEEAKAALAPFPKRGFRTEVADLARGLEVLGFRLSLKGRSLRGKTEIEVAGDAVVIVQFKTGRDGVSHHWLVWDGSEKRLLDPLRPRAKKTYDLQAYFKLKKRRA